MAADEIIDQERESGNLVIPLAKMPIAAFQAIYHQITRRTDTLQKVYKTQVSLSANSIQDLHHLIFQTVSQYSIKGQSSKANLSLDNGETIEFSDVEKFLVSNNRVLSARSTNLVLSYDFLIVRPVEINDADNIAQRLKISVTVESRSYKKTLEIYDEDFIYIGSTFGPSVKVVRPNCRSSIEYSDISIARSVQSVLDEWVRRMTIVDDEALDEKAVTICTKAVNYSIPITAVAMLVASIFLEVKQYNNLITPIRYILIVASLTIGIAIIAAIAADRINTLFRVLQPAGRLDLTDGDAKSIKELSKSRRKAKTSISLVVVGVVLSFIIGLLVNYVSTIVLPNNP
ncbi:hypothetical protein [Sphingomonas sp. Y38-1Y]|uniref:hypothetical protein n=1 Tax=Sphingomonas sp. Y38-1Y TaxID=3078265 RepID=UPI0028EDB5AA|nr:hypothetical protein [Sphingomonas sp. Y38-1Y]